MSTATLRVTADEFARRDNRGKELVDGNMVELPPSVPSSLTAGEIIGRLWQFARSIRSEWLSPLVRAYNAFPMTPIVFANQMRASFDRTGPDLVVEVVSPNDLATEVDRKEAEYLAAGVTLVWVTQPRDADWPGPSQ